MKLCAVGLGTMNSFVNAVADVPHFTSARITEGSVEGVHFIATERTPALTTIPVGLDGATAISTTLESQDFCPSTTQGSVGLAMSESLTFKALRNSLAVNDG